jgi:predicted dehydrogenase
MALAGGYFLPGEEHMSNENAEFLRRFGRRLRLGMVGGGFDSVIGETHRIAFQADGLYDLVAGAFSVDPEVARNTGRTLLVSDERNYADYRDMAAREAARADGIDVVVIATPPQVHAAVARAFLEQRIHVVCEKPLTRTLDEAVALQSAVDASDRIFVLTHCYSGFPMVRQARELVRSGALGRVRMVEAEFAGGAPGVALEPEDPARRHWRFRAAVAGKEGLLGEVGTHAYHLMRYVTGMTPERLAARMQTFAERREVYDNAYLDFSYETGAVGRLWSSYVATGTQHGFALRVYGDRAGLEWREEDAEFLRFRPLDQPELVYRAGQDGTPDFVTRSARFRPGHPEGYSLAFANLYVETAFAIAARATGEPASCWLDNLPGIGDGVAGMRMIAASAASNERDGAWVDL